jgi:hypothetical protein
MTESMTESMTDQIKELNDDWIFNFEKTDKLYKDFYKDDVYYVNIHYIYINKSNNIEKIKKESLLLSIPNIVTREEIIGILKKNSIIDNINYSVLSILRYNITIDNEDIHHFLKNSISMELNNNYLTPIKNFDAIKFEKTIYMFQDLNDLLFVFYEKTKSKSNSNTKSKTKTNKNVTKKIYLKSNNKKLIPNNIYFKTI